MSVAESILEQGHYLAPVSKTIPFRNFVFGMTEYPHPVETGQWHAHENSMISFVMDGGNIENRKTSQIQRSCGSINFYHAFEAHQNIYQEFPSRHFSIEINPFTLSAYGLEEEQICKAVNRNPFSKFLFLKILNEVYINDCLSEDSVIMLFLELVHSNKLGIPDTTSPSWVNTLKELLNDNWNQQLSLQQLAEVTGIHPVTISGNFRKYFSCTFGEYMRKIKVEQALSMIRNSSQNLTQIAHICGFADQSHFTRTFKQQTGLLPKKYKKL
ncbi:MAG: helix-turn-helix transcriptional regulator [Balneolaceae bacterium]|nr:helix-turn-helix transcriptional regulator [Balneolaceae bacterium]